MGNHRSKIDELSSKKTEERLSEQVPKEIDTHLHLYGKHAWEVQYGEYCPLCQKRIDEYGFCACGSAQ